MTSESATGNHNMENGSFKYSYKIKTKESLALAVYNTGMQQCESGYSWGPAVRDHFLIHYVISGKGSYECAGKSYFLQAGDLFLVYPNEIVSYCADKDEPWQYCWVGFNGTEVQRMLNLTPFRHDNLVLSLPDQELYRRLIDIYEARGNKPTDELNMIGRLYLFLGKMVELQGANRPESDVTSDYIETALKFIQYNYSHSIDITSIAASIKISRSHLYRVFIKHLRLSPNDYLTQYRINRACALLRNSNLTISNIANSVGYDDPLYFSRVFKKVKGVSPSIYLKNILTEEDEQN